MLMALGLPLPKKIFGHPWLLSSDDNSEGIKMSKSRGNVLYPDDLIKIFGVDGIRFYLLHEMPFDNDGVVNLKLITERFNSELANVLGNLVSRTIAMINKYFDGILENKNLSLDIDNSFFNDVNVYIKNSIDNMEKLKIADAIDSIFDIFKRCNKYIDETEPWVLAKNENDTNRLKTVLYNLSLNIVKAGKLLFPYMPETSMKILNMFSINDITFNNLSEYKIMNGIKVTNDKENLFVRKNYDEVEEYFGKDGLHIRKKIQNTIFKKFVAISCYGYYVD